MARLKSLYSKANGGFRRLVVARKEPPTMRRRKSTCKSIIAQGVRPNLLQSFVTGYRRVDSIKLIFANINYELRVGLKANSQFTNIVCFIERRLPSVAQ